MQKWTTRSVTSALLIGLALMAGCRDASFPVAPAPLANTPVVTLQGANYQGTIALGGSLTTTFNMTLIARGLGQTSPQLAEQAPGTVLVSGNFETGNGIKGTIEGTLEGTLANGTFRGTLTVITGGCTEQREYSGQLTGSGVALVPGNHLQSCPNNVLTFTVQLARPLGSACSFSIAPTVAAVPATAGTASVNISTSADCPWAAEALASFLSINGPATGTGTGTLNYNFQANTGDPRSGTLRVAGQILTVNQARPCTYSIAPTSATVAATGGSGTVSVTAPDGCDWTAQSLVDWINVSPTAGTGNGSITFTAQANPGAERQGTVTIAGQTFSVSQPALPACTYTVSPTVFNFGPEGDTGNTFVTASEPRCAWTAQSGAPWLQLTGPASGSGSANIPFTVQPNPGPARSGTIVVAGQTVTVNQAALPPCVYQFSPPNPSFPAAGGSGGVTIGTAARCSWTVRSDVPWIELTSPATGVGPATVTYRVLANPGPLRTGSVTVIGQTATLAQPVTQLGATASIIVTGTSDFTGDGTVTSAPPGLTCSIVEGTAGAGCSAAFPVGSQVTLTATAGAQSAFAFWGGACAQFEGAPACVLDVKSTADINVSAAFRFAGGALVR